MHRLKARGQNVLQSAMAMCASARSGNAHLHKRRVHVLAKLHFENHCLGIVAFFEIEVPLPFVFLVDALPRLQLWKVLRAWLHLRAAVQAGAGILASLFLLRLLPAQRVAPAVIRSMLAALQLGPTRQYTAYMHLVGLQASMTSCQ